MYEDLDSGRFATINESVEFDKTNIVSLDNLSKYVILQNVIMCEPENFFTKNINIFKQHTSTIILQYKYKYNPKYLSKDLYGTTEFYPLLLALNDCPSARSFTMETIKVVDTAYISEILQLIDRESPGYMASKENPTVIENDE